jgi:hypothetical protein
VLTATLPTRDFVLILDPYCLEVLLAPPLRTALTLIRDFATLAPPITVNLIFPHYLATADQQTLAETGLAPLIPFHDEGAVPVLTLSRDIRGRVRGRIERGAEGEQRGLRLLALAHSLKADGIVTAVPSLVEPRHELLRHHRFRIVPPEEFPDLVEVCARGHDVPCAALPAAPTYLPAGTLYQFAHWKGRLLFNWFNHVAPSLSADAPLRELLRSALLNRYAFVLRARDMVRFYQLQADRHVRYGQKIPVFREPLNYHLTAFYTHGWGMLDTLAQIANRRLVLRLNPFRCHINRDDFLQALGNKRPGLRRFVREHGGQWVPIIGDVRHPIAHSALRLQSDLVAATADSKKSDEEIASILRDEDPDFYTILPPGLVKDLEPMMIANWRLNKMKIVSDDVINIEKAEGGYFRQPVASIDFDLDRINAFIDAFLVGCFDTSSPPATEVVSPSPSCVTPP